MTNNLCKSYIKQVKMFFPTVSMKERLYIKKLSNNIIEYCDDNYVNDISVLYDVFGRPEELFGMYLQNIDIDTFAKKINLTKILKRFFVAMLIAGLILLVARIAILAKENADFQRSLIYYQERVILD